jgi:hypothetical protein
MATYLVRFSGATYIEAETREEAIDKAWTEEAVHAEDITTIENVDNIQDPNICPSSLDEHGEPVDGVGAHKPDPETGICDECGANTRD